ncbi:MAG TPA: PEGA domain-containing protein, partial [Kofleriaceae bacterium]|nr:PEGA domain-containing protein [Kofleriaceae bacterium]
LVDGKPIGVTPLEYTLPLGDHRIVLQAAGRVAETRGVSIKKGQTATVEVTLAASPRSKLPYAVIGGGVALAIAGGILLAIDEDPDPSKTANPTYLDTGPGGAALLATGVVAIGAGVYLAVRGGGRRSDAPRSAPTVSVLRGGGLIGWAGRF